MSRPRFWFILLAAIAGGSVAHGQGVKLIELLHADTLLGRVIDGQDARELSGNVQIKQDNVLIFCDRAVQYIDAGKVLLTGRVVVRDDSMTITTPRGAYFRDARRAEAYDRVILDDGVSHLEADYGTYDVDPRVAFFRSNVKARDTSAVLHADTLIYERNIKRMHATGRVRILNEEDAVTITGGDLLHDGTTGHSRVTVSPVLVKLDSAGAGAVDTLIVESRVMESFRDSVKRLVASDSVRFVRKTLAGRAGRVVFFTAGDSLELRTMPILWYEATQVTGDSINVYLRKRALESIVVMGKAFAVSRSDSAFPDRFDQLAGERITMQFRERALRRISVDEQALSVYYLYEDSAANGLNRASGDGIVMSFDEGRAKTIHIVGGVEGKYFPEPMVYRREREYALPGFLWRGDRPDLHPPTQKAALP